MNSNPSSEIETLQHAIAALESQRIVLGDVVVDTAIRPLRERLAQLEGARQPPVPVNNLPSAEQRKLVTVLFADLVGFTAMSEHLDPEDVRDITNVYFSRWTSAIEQFGGTVEKFIGDAVMAVFGLAAADEHDPENAIQAALAMRAGLKALNEELAVLALSPAQPIQLRMRVGIHTGQVVVSWLGERKGQDFLVVGDTVNLASRLQALAPVNGILITHDTYRHVRGLFDVQVLQPVAVKGKRDLVQTYVLLQARPRVFRRKLEGVEGIETALIGRARELADLQAFFHQVSDRCLFQAVTIVGEAGIGKSRLLLEFDHWLEDNADYYFFHGRANPSFQKLPFGLLRDVFANRFDIQDSDSPEILHHKLVVGVSEALSNIESPAPDRFASGYAISSDSQVAETEMKAHFIGRLMGFGFGDSPFLDKVEPKQVMERGLIYLNEYFSALASQDPLVLLLEDLHWADDSTLDWLMHMETQFASLPLMFVCTTRSDLFDRRPTLREEKPGQACMLLNPLSPADSQRQVEMILCKVQNLPPELVQLIVRSAEGNPFYVEELIKMLVEDGVLTSGEDAWQVSTHRLAGLKVPPTLIEVLQARLDRLSPEDKALLQRAAVVGRTFWDQALAFMMAQDASPRPSGTSIFKQEDARLDRLVQREIVYCQDESTFENTREFIFKHALLRDVTYASLLKNYRRIYHAHAALWLEEVSQHSQRADEFAALIAEHYHLAGEARPAGEWFYRAARRAAEGYANREALFLYDQAFSSTTPEQAARRAELLLAKIEIQGLIGERSEQLRLFEQLDEQLASIEDPQTAAICRARAFYQRAVYAMQTGDYNYTIEAARQAVELARRSNDRVLEARAQSIWAGAYRYLADYPRARQHYEITRRLGEQAGLITLQANALLGMGVVCEVQAEYLQARTHLEAALELYRQANDLQGVSRALNSLGVIETNLSAVENAVNHLEEAIKLKRLMGDRFGQGVTLCNLGVVMERRYDFEMAVEYFRQSLAISLEIDDGEGKEAALIGIGNNQMAMGQYEDARQTLQEAIVISRKIEDLQGEADILTSLGEIEIESGSLEAGMTLCRQVIELTQEIGAPSEMAYALFYLGIGLERLGSFAEAEIAYQQCLEIRLESGQHSQAIDALSGLARAAGLQGDQQQAQKFALQAIETPGWEYGLSEPTLAYLSCFQALISTDPDLAIQTLKAGSAFLQRVAGQFRSQELRSTYLESVRSNQALLTAAARLNDTSAMIV